MLFLVLWTAITLCEGKTCYQGWVRERSTCYRAFPATTLSWQLASVTCRDLHGQLVTISDLTEQTRILELRPEDSDKLFWIGYHKNTTVWQWSRTENTTFNGMDTSNQSLSGNCAAIDKKGEWLATPCDRILPFFCEGEAIECNRSGGWIEEVDGCLLVSSVNRSWWESRRACSVVHSELAVLPDRVSNLEIVNKLGPRGEAWVGITLDASEGKYKWLDGSDVIGTPLNKLNKSSVCGAIHLNASGHIEVTAQACTRQLGSVCQRAMPHVKHTVKGTTAPTSTLAVRTSSRSGADNWLYTVLKCAQNSSSTGTRPMDCLDMFLKPSHSLCERSWPTLDVDVSILNQTEIATLLRVFAGHVQVMIKGNTPFSKCHQDITRTLDSVHIIVTQLLEASTDVDPQLNVQEQVYFVGKRLSSNTALSYELVVPGCLVTNISTHTDSLQNAALLLSVMLTTVDPYKVQFEIRGDASEYFVVSSILSLAGQLDGNPTSLSHIYSMFHHRKQDMVDLFKANATSVEVICGFYDARERVWSSWGCHVVSSEQYTSTCTCNHTTSFAVLMKITNYKVSHGHEVALSVITSVGCSISMVTMFIALTIFTCIRDQKIFNNTKTVAGTGNVRPSHIKPLEWRSLSSERVYVHRNLCLAILCAQVAFLAGIKATQHKVVCRIAAILLHYCYTAVFTWMFVEGLHLYTKVVQVFGTENTRTTYYLCFGWGIPLLLVTISAVADIEGYGSSSSCWLSIYRKTIWAFVGPAVAVITVSLISMAQGNTTPPTGVRHSVALNHRNTEAVCVNLCILVMVLRIVVSSAKTDQPRHWGQVRAGAKGAIILLPLLGLTWLFGLLAINKDLIMFEYMFALFNSLQGFFVFLFHCLLNTEVRDSLKRVREQHALRNGVSVTSSFTDTCDSTCYMSPPTGTTLRIEAGVRLYLPVNLATDNDRAPAGRVSISPAASTMGNTGARTRNGTGTFGAMGATIRHSVTTVEDEMALAYM